jgi:hypothetical protein
MFNALAPCQRPPQPKQPPSPTSKPSNPRPPGSDNRFLKLTPSLFGDVRLAGNLSAEVAASIREALDTRNSPDRADAPIRRSVGQRNHDALGDIADEFLSRTTTSPDTEKNPRRKPRPTGNVLIDFNTFTRSNRSNDTKLDIDLASIRRDLLNTGPIPARTAQLMTCDADIQRLVVDPHGQPLTRATTRRPIEPRQPRIALPPPSPGRSRVRLDHPTPPHHRPSQSHSPRRSHLPTRPRRHRPP